MSAPAPSVRVTLQAAKLYLLGADAAISAVSHATPSTVHVLSSALTQMLLMVDQTLSGERSHEELEHYFKLMSGSIHVPSAVIARGVLEALKVEVQS